MSTQGADGHPDTGVLAEDLEGLLSPEQERSVRAHLATCDDCTRRRAALAEVPARLAAAADTGPLPGDVAARLHEALAAAAPSALPTAARPRVPWGMRVLQAAAVLVVVLAGVGLAASLMRAGSERDTTSAAGGAADKRASAPEQGYPVTASGRNWSEGSLPGAVPDLVAGRIGPSFATPQSAGGPTTMQDAPRDTARLASGAPLAACVAALADGPVTPLAVDLATWKGEPAGVIVLPTPDDPSTVDAWVVRPSCDSADAGVLYFARVRRP